MRAVSPASMQLSTTPRIRKRHFVFPLDYTITARPLDRTSCEYKTHAIRMGRRAAEQALRKAALAPSDIDLIITVSCTGLAIPSLDAHLANLMGFRSDIKRLPDHRAWVALRGRPHSAEQVTTFVPSRTPMS